MRIRNSINDIYSSISIIITTKNRSETLKKCLDSLLKVDYLNKEIIVVDQSTDTCSETIIRALNSSTIRYFRSKTKGSGSGKNFGVSKSLYSIICFLDDDCLVPSNWLKNIALSYKRYPNISAVFGQVLSKTGYSRFFKTVGQYIFNNKRFYSSLPSRGLPRFVGNNWSIRRNTFLELGGFKNWLGPGSIGFGADEDELMFKLLSKGYIVLADPKLYIYHLHRISRISKDILYTKYGSGFFMFSAYYQLFGNKIVNTYIYGFVRNQTKRRIKQFTTAINNKSIKFVGYLIFISIYEIYYYLRGYIVGLTIAATEIVFMRKKGAL